MKRIILVGGGSGGHVYPLIAVAHALEIAAREQQKKLDIRAITDDEKWRQEFMAAGIKTKVITAGKWRRYADSKNYTDIFRVFFGFMQSLLHLFFYMPDVLVCKGSYVSVPPAYAARVFFIPVVIHDSDSVPGLANQKIGAFAKRIFLSFEKAKEVFPGKDVLVTGNPVRQGIASGSAERARQFFQLSGERPVVFVTGGSQGAETLNTLILEGLTLLTKKYDIIHQTGVKNYERVNELVTKTIEEGKGSYGDAIAQHFRVVPYLNFQELADAYELSTVIVSRAGAGNIFELAAVGKPAIVVPISKSVNDHQLLNAYEFSNAGAVLIEEANLTPHLLEVQLEKLLEPENYRQRAQQITTFARPNAARDIAAGILEVA